MTESRQPACHGTCSQCSLPCLGCDAHGPTHNCGTDHRCHATQFRAAGECRLPAGHEGLHQFPPPAAAAAAPSALWHRCHTPTSASVQASPSPSQSLAVTRFDMTECAICFEPLADAPDGQTEQTQWPHLLPGGHTFHSSCITQWYARRTECPVCRASRRPISAGLRPASTVQPRLAGRQGTVFQSEQQSVPEILQVSDVRRADSMSLNSLQPVSMISGPTDSMQHTANSRPRSQGSQRPRSTPAGAGIGAASPALQRRGVLALGRHARHS